MCSWSLEDVHSENPVLEGEDSQEADLDSNTAAWPRPRYPSPSQPWGSSPILPRFMIKNASPPQPSCFPQILQSQALSWEAGVCLSTHLDGTPVAREKFLGKWKP